MYCIHTLPNALNNAICMQSLQGAGQFIRLLDQSWSFFEPKAISSAQLEFLAQQPSKELSTKAIYFFFGDASVLPFGITCINVTDMISKFLMLAKSTDHNRIFGRA